MLPVSGEYLRGNRILCGVGTGMRCPGSNGKLNAAQKRQNKRDERRRKNGIHRTDQMAHRERERKHAQANNRGNARADPYEPGFGDRQYAHKREHNRASRCKKYGLPEDCGWKALDYDFGDDDYDYDHVHKKHYGPNL